MKLRLLSAISYLLLAILAVAAVAPVPLRLYWDANSTEEQISHYTVYQATSVTGPWTQVGSTLSTNYTVEVSPGRYFWYVSASNLWGESPPSNTVGTPPPASTVQGLKLTR